MSEDSRRRFLRGGAVAAAGAMAAVMAPRAAISEVPGGTGGAPSYYPNDNLALAIVKAWSHPEYKAALLTFPAGEDADWTKYSGEYDSRTRKTSKALEDVDVYIDRPVVLTVQQWAGYKKHDDKEVTFVLPDVIGKQYSMATAQVAMAVTPAGM